MPSILPKMGILVRNRIDGFGYCLAAPATGADKIYASNISSVGSIGVTQSYLDETAKDAKDGYKYIELTSVPYKDLGSPSRPITEEEKAIVIADLVKDAAGAF